MPLEPWPWPRPFVLHGRVPGIGPLLWPGGLPADGHGGRGFPALPTTGVGAGVGRAVGWVVGRAVGCAVGVGVGWGVGRGVGWAVGRAVGAGVGRDVGASVGCTVGDGVEPPERTGGLEATEGGVGVGPWATSGPLGVGLADGSIDTDGSGDTTAPDAEEPGVSDAPIPGEEGVVAVGCAELPDDGVLGALLDPTATCGGPGGVSRPAASATVARIRFRSPRATTSRARWAEVTTTDGLLPTGRHGVRGGSPMVAPGSSGRFGRARIRPSSPRVTPAAPPQPSGDAARSR